LAFLTKPKISLITPSFNHALYLEKTIQSILNQAYPNLEYIIMDGGSRDGSLDIIRKYESKISFWTSKPDKGPQDALHQGFSKATGEIMGWLNADDILWPGALDNLAEIFSRFPDVHWISGRPSFIDHEDRLIDVGHVFYAHRLEYLCGGQLLQQESTYWRRSLWEKSGGFIADTMAFDFELWLRFFRHARLYPLRTVIAGFRYRDSQISIKHAGEYEREMKRLIDIELKGDGMLRLKWLLWKPLRKIFRFSRILRLYEMAPYLKMGCPKAIYYDRQSKGFINPNQ